MTALRDAALGYWKMGLRPIPCGPRTKVAAIRWSEYRLRQPTRGEVERRWIEIPDANIALVMGNGMFALDLDGIGAERLLEERGIILPPSAPRSRTAKGFHVILASPRPVPNRIRLLGDPARGIDVRGDGGLIVVPPSIHPSGVAYEWVTPLVMLPPAAPEALLALIANAAGPTSSRVPTGDWVLDALQGVDEGARDATCTASTPHAPTAVSATTRFSQRRLGIREGPNGGGARDRVALHGLPRHREAHAGGQHGYSETTDPKCQGIGTRREPGIALLAQGLSRGSDTG